jgi:small subunit ribosomal protein S20
MPHTSSAKKRARQYEKRRLYNRAYKKEIKDQIKVFLAAAASGNKETAGAEFKKAVKKLDKAASRRVIHPNKAARKKAQLAAALAGKGPAAAAAAPAAP